MYSSILPIGFNIGSWSKGLEDSVATHKPNVKTGTQTFNSSSGGSAAFNAVKSTQHPVNKGQRKRKRGTGNFVTAAVKDALTQTKEKEQMLTPAAQNTNDSLNVAATSIQSKTKKKATKKKSTATAAKKSAPKSTTTTIKRLGKARETQFNSGRQTGNKSKKS